MRRSLCFRHWNWRFPTHFPARFTSLVPDKVPGRRTHCTRHIIATKRCCLTMRCTRTRYISCRRSRSCRKWAKFTDGGSDCSDMFRWWVGKVFGFFFDLKQEVTVKNAIRGEADGRSRLWTLLVKLKCLKGLMWKEIPGVKRVDCSHTLSLLAPFGIV
jgi:hypothetical protein